MLKVTWPVIIRSTEESGPWHSLPLRDDWIVAYWLDRIAVHKMTASTFKRVMSSSSS